MIRDISSLNRRLHSKGIIVLPVKHIDGRVLVYVYRPKLLKAYLSRENVRAILTHFGYDTDNVNSCIRRMISRLEGDTFPHEIGLFLGYPPEDVQGFIDNNGKNFKVCGMWKVYGDECKCCKLFAQYNMCTRSYLEAYRSGNTIERLAVAV